MYDMKERGMMSRKKRRSWLPLLGTILLGSLAGLSLMIWKRFSKKTPPATIIKHQVNTRPNDTLTYWTAEKMRNATAADLPHVNALDEGKERPRHS